MTAPDHHQNGHGAAVLVALDGSSAAATALPVARLVAAQLHAGIEILHVAPTRPAAPDLARRLLLERENLDGVEIHLHVGEPAAEILRASSDPRVALVVLATHGRVIEPGRQLGHVAEAVIAGAERPVLLVRPEATRQHGARLSALRRLLVPLDGTPGTATALRSVTELAGRLGASLDLLYVAGPSRATPGEPGSIGAPLYVDQPQHEWPGWEREMIERLMACAECPAGVEVRMFLARGEIGVEVTRFAAEHEDDAIVLVRRSRLEPGRAPALRAILDRTPCPILLVGGPPA